MPRDVSLSDIKCWNGGQKGVKNKNFPFPTGNLSGGFSLALEEGTVRADVPLLSQDSSITVGKGKCSVASPQEYRLVIRIFFFSCLQKKKLFQ